MSKAGPWPFKGPWPIVEADERRVVFFAFGHYLFGSFASSPIHSSLARAAPARHA